MRINQFSTIMKLVPFVHMGYIFKSTQPGIGLVEETKKLVSDVWKQKFVYVNMAQSDMYDVHLLLVEHAKEMEPTTFYFDEMEKLTDEMRNFIFNRFSICREKYIHPDCHVIYGTNPNTEFYQVNEWNDFIVCHSAVFNFEQFGPTEVIEGFKNEILTRGGNQLFFPHFTNYHKTINPTGKQFTNVECKFQELNEDEKYKVRVALDDFFYKEAMKRLK